MRHKRNILLFILLNIVLGGLVWFGINGAPFPASSEAESSLNETLKPILQTSWKFYKTRFMADGSHVTSNTYSGTISEGQSYAMLKAVWMDDPESFQRTWQWTQQHMKRPNDHLLGWHWGKRDDGAMGLIEDESATDADQDIAYALLLAGEKWHNPAYIQDARLMITDLWNISVKELDGTYYLTPGTWEGFYWEYMSLAPAYFAPYVYHKFADYDALHAAGWKKLANDVYDTLEACSNLTKPQLPPNWCGVKWKDDGQGSRIIFSDRQGDGSRNFGYDSFRVYWRMAMDAKLNPTVGKERAKAYLKKHSYLLTYWQQHQQMPEGFSPDGNPLSHEDSGFTLGPLLVTQSAKQLSNVIPLHQNTLAKHYNSAGYWFNDYNDYLHSVIWLHLYSISLQSEQSEP